jgi:adenylate cyclase
MNRGGPAPAVPTDTLDSWKAIAAYLHRDVRTVVRWEHDRGLPVHRVPGGGRAGVFALRSELDAWWNGDHLHLVEQEATSTPNPTSPSIAVLPFANLSSDQENEYFGQGLADEVITALTRIQGLRVTARTSSFAFHAKEQDIRQIGVRLGVTSILEGSIQRCGGRVRVTAQLTDVKDGFLIWGAHYDRDQGDAFAIEDDISQAIARALEVRLTNARAVRPTRNQEAYNCWLKGRYYQHYENLEALAKCRTHLTQAIALDPLFPQPYLGLAELARATADLGVARPREALAEGWAAIRKASELDASLGEVHALSGAYRAWMDFDWKGAEADFAEALELTPASAEAHRLRATHYLVPTGRLREAEEEMERAVESDPLSPLAYIELGKVLLWARQFDRAQAAMEVAFELRPEYPPAVWYRGVGLYFQGRIEEGLQYWRCANEKRATPVGDGAIGMALAQLGRHAEARAALAGLENAARERYVPQLSRAQIHMALGETDATFHWLEQAVEERDPHILDIPCKPIWDPLRSDPRFTALLRRMRLL